MPSRAEHEKARHFPHVRPSMPAAQFRSQPFYCCVCGERCDPRTEQWTSLEYTHQSLRTLTEKKE